MAIARRERDGQILCIQCHSERMAGFMMPMPRGIKIEHANLGGVAGDWLIPPLAPDDPVIVFLHGGGIIFGWSKPNHRLVEVAQRYDLKPEITLWPGVWHAWDVLAPVLPEATQALKKLGEVVRERAAESGRS